MKSILSFLLGVGWHYAPFIIAVFGSISYGRELAGYILSIGLVIGFLWYCLAYEIKQAKATTGGK